MVEEANVLSTKLCAAAEVFSSVVFQAVSWLIPPSAAVLAVLLVVL